MDQVFQRNGISVILTAGIQTVIGIVHGDKANMKEWQYFFKIGSGFDVISAETGQVFDHNAVDFSTLDGVHHFIKAGTVEVRS
ncbi:hypothetical protein SDC9_111266 [bioreactor metagenome]|uniref:Uncharacterized protein n=1 Tax=bioreactor metagenome TaxID=1076179 RepID=A0A645BG17_9ZZZZ